MQTLKLKLNYENKLYKLLAYLIEAAAVDSQAFDTTDKRIYRDSGQ